MLGLRIHHLPATFFVSKPSHKFTTKSSSANIRHNYDYIYKNQRSEKDDLVRPANWSNNLISLAIAVALITPLPSSAIPAFGSKSLPLPSAATPFSQAQNLPTGLEDGYFCCALSLNSKWFLVYRFSSVLNQLFLQNLDVELQVVCLKSSSESSDVYEKIRPCPSVNPGCVSSNPRSSSFAFPWTILGKSTDDSAVQQLEDAIIKTQKNVKLQPVEDTPSGKYLQAEVDGRFGRDVLEFLVNGNVVAFRGMATKVTYVYPFTTALGDSRGQEERLKRIVNELGWYAPSFDSMD
ncbi:thylakoid lumenal 17.9 kDa protein, chloroplastic-like [Dorcoceras hygrometricum]|uniref:Thylakoid lumenal 17.9 kDa protein, chloroplastic-like n=1 Tax=Dorcoceras hygrometricum TaxID=472368 RepID=A0A2Z7CJ50_9LAMI|nr:thylakoid lumenal 17.9 kDa protein, chloroplastic-like [Dorcoceras hygrometricum]